MIVIHYQHVAVRGAAMSGVADMVMPPALAFLALLSWKCLVVATECGMVACSSLPN
jgi:hypothetical protein